VQKQVSRNTALAAPAPHINQFVWITAHLTMERSVWKPQDTAEWPQDARGQRSDHVNVTYQYTTVIKMC